MPKKSVTVSVMDRRIDVAATQRAVGRWATRNFGDKMDSVTCVLGVIEETGELAHAILKKHQGIRGTPEEHNKAARDAIGDATIYILHLCYLRKWAFSCMLDKGLDSLKDFQYADEGSLEWTLGIACRVGELARAIPEDDKGAQYAIANWYAVVQLLCWKEGWDFEQILTETWNGVKNRDWKKYPKNGVSE